MVSVPSPESFVKALNLPATVSAEILAKIKNGLEPLQALQHSRPSLDLDHRSRARLFLCIDIVEVCGGNLQASVKLFKDAECSSIGKIAQKFYCAKDPVLSTTEIRNNLLYRVPTAVLSAITDSGVLKLEDDIQSTLAKILDIAVNDDFNIRAGSLGELLARPSCQAELSNLSTKEALEVHKLLETLYRLQSLVVDAEDIRFFIGTRFISARIIASTGQDAFIDEMEALGLPFEKSAKIHLEATRIDRRNESIWIDIISSRRQVPVLAITGRQPDGEPPEDSVGTNLSTLFQDLDSVAYDDSTSVLSPASYLVDLLQLLKTVPLKLSPKKRVSNAKRAYDVLLHRRPDIASIKLSKEGTEAPVPYLDLAIEVMERYLGNIINPDGDLKEQKRDIYTKISHQLVPMAVFPCNNAIMSSRELLQARSLSRHELLRCFQSDKDLLRNMFSGEIPPDLSALATVRGVHGRRLALELLDLQPMDFQAIAQEDYHTHSFFRLLQSLKPDLAAKTYAQAIGLHTAGEYWGFQGDSTSTASAKMLESLKLVKQELLARSGLTPAKLNAVLKTRYIGNRLVLTLARGSEFSDRLDDMRIQESLLVKSDIKAGVLSERTFLDLQAFLRLHHKLGWSVELLDAAIATLSRRSQVYDNDNRRHYVLDGGFVERLAAVQQLSIDVGIPIAELLPFWNAMDAHTASSLYAKLFLTNHSADQYPSLGLVAGDTKPESTFGDHLAAINQALRITQVEQSILMDLLHFDAKTPWTLANTAQLYSHSKLYKILKLPIRRYPEWLTIIQKVGNPFLDPHSTRAVLEPWLDSTRHGSFKSADAMLDLLTEVPVPAGKDVPLGDIAIISTVIAETSTIESWASSLCKKLPDIEAAQAYSAEVLLSLCSRLLSPTESKDIVAMVEDRLNPHEGGIRVFCQQFKIASADLSKIFAIKVPRNDPEAAEKVLTTRRHSVIQLMVPELKRRSQDTAVQNSIAIRFPDANADLLQQFLRGTLSIASSAEPRSCIDYLNGLLGLVREWLKTPAYGRIYFSPPASTTYHFSTDKDHGEAFLNERPLGLTAGDSKRRVSDKEISLRQGRPAILSFSGGLCLQDLSYSTSSGDAILDERVVYPVHIAKEISTLLRQFDRSLRAAKLLKLDAAEVAFHCASGIDLARLDLGQLTRLEDFVQVRADFKVSGAELIKYLHSLSRISAQHVEEGAIAKEKEEKNGQTQLFESTRVLTRANKDDLATFFDMEWPNESAGDRAKSLAGLSPLRHLAECRDMSKVLAVPMATLYKWARCPLLLSDVEGFDTIDDMESVLTSSGPANALLRARESKRQRQRIMLQEYLLRTKDIQEKGIETADDLSAELLIDVQMGPVLQTSRVAQAIASVQTFTQRCLLGLEKDYGIPTDKIDQGRWKWMCKYNLWQANRKVFLYPENWLEPSLRDDKTQAFEEMESKMMQVNLNKDTIAQLLREYVYTAHEVADLQIQSYLWEGTRGFRGNFHFFGRTRTAPYVFYHRRLQVTGANAAAVQWNWLPWTKMEVDIQTHDVSVDQGGSKATLQQQAQSQPGSYLLPALFKSRLFLFIPQITKQALRANASPLPGKSLFDAFKEASGPPPPEQCWEIKMAWTELRNGKWSSKYVTSTGILVKRVSEELPDISAFRFRLATRPGVGVKADSILQIHVDQWRSSSTDEPHGPGTFLNLGCFELQGPRVRLVDALGGSTIGSTTDAQLEFSRMAHITSASEGSELSHEVGAVKTGIDDGRKSLLAIPDPEVVGQGVKYQLTWALSYDNSHPYGSSGLVVERATPSEVQSFFGFPSFDSKGNYDLSLSTTLVTATLTHAASLKLVEEIADQEGYEGIFDALEQLPKDMTAATFGQDGDTYSELFEPGALYSWELGFHAVSLLMERLLATQQFDLALEVSRLVFDPARDDVVLKGLNNAQGDGQPKPLSRLDRCWRFVPFKWHKLRLAGSVRDLIQRLAPGHSTSTEILEWQMHPFSPHAVARGRPAVYMKRFVMKRIEILIASGDSYFRQESREAMPLATQRYVEAAELFGPAPLTMESPTRPVTKAYADIEAVVNDFATASVDLELEFPYFVNPFARGQEPDPKPKTRDGTLGFVRTTYFGVPANPQMQALRNLIDDRLYKIRNGLDINGHPRRLPLFDPPLDPGQLIASTYGSDGGISLSSLADAGSQGPMPNYRARFLLGRAAALCAELKSFSDSYLSIREKRDAEAMSSLRTRQEGGFLALMAETKEHTLREATLSVEALEESRKGHVSRLRYYLDLIGESADDFIPNAKSTTDWKDLQQDIGAVTKDELRMSPEEVMEMTMTEAAIQTNAIATALEQSTAVLMTLPKIVTQIQPMGVGTSMQTDASIIANGMMAGAGVIRSNAQASSDMANRASRKAQMIRQLQERRMQANAAGRDIKAADRQISAQKQRIEIAQLELKTAQQQATDNSETEAFLRTKYTSERLYSWLEIETRKLAYQTYLTAHDMARLAERALTFEYGPRAQSCARSSSSSPGAAGSFLANSYWDDARDGLLAASQLSAAIQRIENFVVHNVPHDFELTKVISLRQIDPMALINLRIKGFAEFAFPEVIFDHDFPGHYCRRIKTVSVSIPSIMGPYTGVNCTLRLLQHRYRLRSGGGGSSSSSSNEDSSSYYLEDSAGDSDLRFHTDRVPISAIALSTGNQDSGTFELNFSTDDRYVPFEGAGVISRWSLEFPAPYPQFDYRSISDVLVTVRYTALDGGAMWKKEAADAVREFRSQVSGSKDGNNGAQGGASILVDLPVDFAGEWHRVKTQLVAAGPSSDTPITMNLSRLPNMLPFWSPRHTTNIVGVSTAIQPATNGWQDDEGELKILDRVLTEQDTSSEKLRLLGNATFDAIGIDESDLSLSFLPKRFKGKVPLNFWVLIHFTRSL